MKARILLCSPTGELFVDDDYDDLTEDYVEVCEAPTITLAMAALPVFDIALNSFYTLYSRGDTIMSPCGLSHFGICAPPKTP